MIKNVVLAKSLSGRYNMLYLLILILFMPVVAAAQKMVILEKANRAKTTRFYIGESLRFRYDGEEHWYRRPINDVDADKQVIMLGMQPVAIAEIAGLKVRRHPVWQGLGIIGLSYGISMTFANTVSLLRGDPDPHGLLYATAAGGFGLAWWLTAPRKLTLGKKHRLRAIEVPLTFY